MNVNGITYTAIYHFSNSTLMMRDAENCIVLLYKQNVLSTCAFCFCFLITYFADFCIKLQEEPSKS